MTCNEEGRALGVRRNVGPGTGGLSQLSLWAGLSQAGGDGSGAVRRRRRLGPARQGTRGAGGMGIDACEVAGDERGQERAGWPNIECQSNGVENKYELAV